MAKDLQKASLKNITNAIKKIIDGDQPITLKKVNDNKELDQLIDTLNELVENFNKKIEKQKNSIKSIKENEKHYRTFLENAADAFFLFDPSDEKIIDVNNAACESLNYTRKELLTMKISEIDIEIADKNHKEKLWDKLSIHHPVTTEGINKRKDGSIFPVEVKLSLLENVKGNYVIAVVRDITERKRSNAELLRMQFSVDKAKDPVYWIGSDAMIEYANEAACKMLGYSKEELTSKILWEIDPEFPKDRWKEHWNKTRNTESYTIETVHRTKDRETIPVEISINFMKFGGLEYHSAIARDIRERKLSEKKLKENEELLRNFMDSASDSFIITDSNLKVVDLNKSVIKKLEKNKIKKEEIIGKDLSYIIPDFSTSGLEEKYLEVLHTGKSLEIDEYKPNKKFGNVILRLQVFKVDDGLGIISTDITEQKLRENEIRESEERLRLALLASKQGLFDFDIISGEGKFSNEYAEILGYSLSELDTPLSSFFNRIYPEDRKKIEDVHKDLLSGKISEYNIEFRHQTKSGGYKWILSNGKIVEWDKQKKPIRLLGTITDITERKNAEEELLLTNYFVDHSSISKFLTTEDGKIERINERACIALGYTKEEILNSYITDINPSINQENWRNLWSELNAYGAGIFEATYKRKDNSTFPVEVTANYSEFNNKAYVIHFVQDITERKKIEDELKKSEEKYRNIFLNSPLGIYRTTPDGKIIDANPAILTMLGYNSFEELSKSNLELEKHHSEDTPRKVFKELIEKQEYINGLESIWYKKDFTELHVREYARVVKDTNGNILFYEGTVEDISEIKKAYQNLQDSESKLKESQNIAKLGSYILHFETSLWESSEILNNIFGIDKNFQTNVEEWFQLIHPEHREEMKDYFINKVMKNHEMFNKEYKILRYNDKKGRWVHGIGKLEFDKNGNLHKMIGTIQDITERKEIEEELRKSEARLSEAQRVAHIGNWDWDFLNNTLFWSVEVYRIFGLDPANIEATFDHFIELVHPDDVEMVKTSINKALYEKEIYSIDLRIILPDKNIIYIHTEGKVEFNNFDQPERMYGIIQNITERKKFESEIITAKEKAEEMNRLKTHFLANMSHELRTPLFGIIGFIELLAHEISNPDQKDMINAIHVSSKRLSDTLNLILDLSKIESNMVDFNPVEFNIAAISSELLNNFKETADRKNIYLNMIFDSDKMDVNIDRSAYESIFNSLVQNALKFTKEGGVTVKLSVDNNEEESLINLEVSDTGIGIARENFNLIFEEFRQVSEGFERNFEGTGLGLNITKKLVEKLKGTISIESKLNAGTTFKVKIPFTLQPVLAKKTSGDFAAEIKDNADKNFMPYILIVDDDINVKQILSIYLSNNYNLKFTDKGDDAVSLAKNEKFDIIIMDINLGIGTDGVMATQQIRKIDGYSNTPIIACTAYAMSGDKEEFLAAGCSHYLAKPFSKKDLMLLLKEILV